MDTRSELLRKLEEADIDGANTSSGVVRDSEMYEKINYIIGYVFLMFTFQMGAICGTLWIIERSTNAEDRFMAAVEYRMSAVTYFIITSIFTVSTSLYHSRFPYNVVILTVNLSGLAVVFLIQVLKFGLERSKLSDIPAVRFASLCCILLSGVSFMAPVFSSSLIVGCLLRLLIIFSTMILTLIGYRLYEEFRFLSLFLLFFVLLYVVWRSERLAREKHVHHAKEHGSSDAFGLSMELPTAIDVTLQILAGPLAVFTGLLAMSVTMLLPQHPWL
ncbi:uncharacterized protein LOC111246961 isoform X1 [Varroa destructor]|uniref:Uncharacterized protein n=1 Tax=Varroa destructor TaxID=109461 RepID=A0A7M7MD28_VARDE|nr:uncharacterized protein LOC111246961 isoform X1 [Varroa destructor]